MVTVIDFKERKDSLGRIFYALVLQGDMELVQSKGSGKFYATARRCSVTSTFNEQVCKNLIGKCMPGSIVKVGCPPFQYSIPESGEIVTLDFRYEYTPVETPLPKEITASIQAS